MKELCWLKNPTLFINHDWFKTENFEICVVTAQFRCPKCQRVLYESTTAERVLRPVIHTIRNDVVFQVTNTARNQALEYERVKIAEARQLEELLMEHLCRA